MLRSIASLLALMALLVGCGNSAAPQHDSAADKAALERVLRQWTHDFNDRKLQDVCGLFADDVVLMYPGSPDRNHTEFCDQMKSRFDDPVKRFHYAEPDIKEILVDGDLAAVQLLWTLTVIDPEGKVLDSTTEDGVDVFQRQSDASWKIRISHAFSL